MLLVGQMYIILLYSILIRCMQPITLLLIFTIRFGLGYCVDFGRVGAYTYIVSIVAL